MRPVRAAIVVIWALAAVAAAAWLALVEVLWVPLRVAGVLLPLSVPAAVVGNLMLTGLFLRGSRSRLVATLPAVTWLVVVVAASSRRPEGDLLLIGAGGTGVVALAFILAGVVAAAFAVGRMLGGGRPAPVSSRPEAPGPAGSGSGGAR
jgi:hypothetical protein